MLLKFLTAQDPMLEMLKWLCEQLMEAELSNQLGADKTERSGSRNGYKAGYRPRRFDTRMGTMYLMVSKGELECTIEILNGHVVCDLICLILEFYLLC